MAGRVGGDIFELGEGLSLGGKSHQKHSKISLKLFKTFSFKKL